MKTQRESKFVNHWGIWVDSESPITGVISNNTPEWLNEEINNGIDLEWEEHVKSREHKKAIREDGECMDCEMWESGNDTILIGEWKKVKGQYEPKKRGEYAAITGEIYTQVVYSKYTKRCALCSPCYPGQGDLDSTGDFLTYDLPPDLYGSGE